MNEDLFRMFSAFMEQYKPTPSTTAAALQEKEAKRTDQAGGSQTKIQSWLGLLLWSTSVGISHLLYIPISITRIPINAPQVNWISLILIMT